MAPAPRRGPGGQQGNRPPRDDRGGPGRDLLKPASAGTGVIAGGPVRAVLEAAGVSDVLSKSLGSSNPINIVHATVAGLKQLKRPNELAERRGLELAEMSPTTVARVRAAA